MTSATAPLRAWMGIGVASVICLNLSYDLYRSMTAYYKQHPNPVAIGKQERRFARLRAELPVGSVLGYYSDIPPEAEGSYAIFNTARYVLTPHLLVPEDAREQPSLVLGNFAKPPDMDRIQKVARLKLLRDFGGGVMLFQRGGK